MKRPYVDLSPDRNFPGLMVCNRGCNDEKDPYRLPARKTERIDLRRPRPDTDISVPPEVEILTDDGFEIQVEPTGQPIIE